MKAIVATNYGPPDVLQLREVAKPVPGDNELLVRVRATTANAGDSRMRSFTVPPMMWLPARITLGVRRPRKAIFGMELAGDVEAVGEHVRRFKAGDQVVASTFQQQFGAHAEYKSLPEDGVLVVKPQNLTYEDAATLPIGAGRPCPSSRPVVSRPDTVSSSMARRPAWARSRCSSPGTSGPW
jgi:NADPH:quinone reductase-like Zn-dependent oxidoreductase